LAEAARKAQPLSLAVAAPDAPAGPVKPTTASYRDAISHWYPDVDEEIAASVRAQQQYPVEEYGLYGRWSAEDAAAPRQVRPSAGEELKPHERGEWRAHEGQGGTAVFNPAHGHMAAPVIEHELTHAVTMPPEKQQSIMGLIYQQDAYAPVWDSGKWDEDASGVLREATARLRSQQLRDGSRKLGVPESQLEPKVPRYDGGDFDPFFNYVGRRAEIDPRLAEMRRRYTHSTGNSVRTPEDAKQAWDWWQNNAADWQFGPNRPTMDLIETRFLDALPETAKGVMYRRMTHLPALLAPVAIGASQPGVLSGLTEER
jgi:hypothetical protein